MARKGERYVCAKAVPVSSTVWYRAPFATGREAMLPPGEPFEVESDPPAGATTLNCRPLRAEALAPLFVEGFERRDRRYQGYTLVMQIATLESRCAPWDGATPLPEDVDEPARFEESRLRLTATRLITPELSYLVAGIRNPRLERVKPKRLYPVGLLLVGLPLAFSDVPWVGLAIIAWAIAWAAKQGTRHTLRLDYGDGEASIPLGTDREFAERAKAAVQAACAA